MTSNMLPQMLKGEILSARYKVKYNQYIDAIDPLIELQDKILSLNSRVFGYMKIKPQLKLIGGSYL